MAESEKVVVDLGASIAYDMMPAALRQRIVERLEALAVQQPEEWPVGEVRRLSSQQPLYLLHVDDELRVIFRPEGGRLHIRQIFVQEMIDQMFAQPPQPPAAV